MTTEGKDRRKKPEVEEDPDTPKLQDSLTA